MPYFAPILFEMRPLNAPGLGTFAVDQGWRLYIDFGSVTARGDLWCGEALLHEVGHLWYEHSARAVDAGLTDENGTPKSAYHGRVSNLAGDAAINDDLIEAGCTTLADAVLPEHIGCKRHETYEFYVQALLKRLPPTQPDNFGEDPGGRGSAAGGMPRPWELPSHDSAGGTAPAAEAADKDRAVQATAVAIVDTQTKRSGTLPGDLVEQAKVVLSPPQLKWQQILRPALRAARSAKPGDAQPTFRKRNRRRMGVKFGSGTVIFPGTFSPTPKLAVVRDTSGSVSRSEFDAFTKEIIGISKEVGIRGEDLIVLDVDAQVQAVTKVNTLADVETRHGFGGTDMVAGVEAALKLKPAPNTVIILTDGFTPWPDRRPKGVSIIACIVTGDGKPDRRFDVPAWIRTVWIASGSAQWPDR